MTILRNILLSIFCTVVFTPVFSQLYQAIPDSICINDGDDFVLNVFDNDFVESDDPDLMPVLADSQGDECFYIDEQGFVRQNPLLQESCCGTHFLSYFACVVIDGEQFCDETTVEVTVKCGKPDCSLFSMLDFQEDPVGGGQGGDCIDVCEESITTFYMPYILSNTYNWVVTVPGGSWSGGANPGEIIVEWGPQGSGNVLVNVTNALGLTNTISVCVNIMEGPTADFSSIGYTCLNAPISFTNLSLNADQYDWDFGDGNVALNVENPTHEYGAPGIYSVTLTATSFNYDSEGNQLCCCVDTITMDVEVDPLPGPNIYWISTLCEGDSSKYWTDATGCSTYNWLVEDEFGNDLPFDGQGNDTICVLWNVGNLGMISLNVDGCDAAYCTNPVTVTVPIIPASSDVDGPDEVCINSTEIYSLPKWNSTEYIWTVLDVNGNPVSFDGQGSHQISINWLVAGISSIHVEYQSEFLSGIFDHDASDCTGSADLLVNVKPFFDLTNGVTLVCPENMSSISATASPSTDYTWSIDPPVSFTGQGTENIEITWDAGPGTYTVTVMSNDPSAYCNTEESVVYQVVDMEAPISIEGADSICVGIPYLYTVESAQPGVGFTWTVVGGSFAPSNASSIEVTWTGDGTISVSQYMLSAPGCSSEPIGLNIVEKQINGPLNVSGTAACTNSISNYTLTPLQIGDAEILWSITDLTDGSIIAGQGTENIQVQWNNDDGEVAINVQVTVCDDTQSYSLVDTIYSPIKPAITQVGVLCPSVTAVLETDPGFVSYLWSNGSPTNTTTISSGGLYSVSTIDFNGCSATSYYTANEIPGAVAEISSGDNPVLCIDGTGSVNIVAQTNPNYYFEWFCDGVSQGPYSATSNLVHTNTGTVDDFNYFFNVVDSLTGCTNTSDIFSVSQVICQGGGCQTEPFTASFTAAPTSLPYCDEYTFMASLTNAGVSSWSFGDGDYSSSDIPSHQYSLAGCYNVRLNINVPELGGAPGDSCATFIDQELCVPVAADFGIEYLTCGDIRFTDNSTFLDLADPIVSWNWSFGSTDQNPPIQNFTNGTHTITLTVTTASGCQATIDYDIEIGAVTIVSVSATSIPSPACVGDPITFSTVSPGAVTWFWDFDDGATFGEASPIHAYDTPDTYDVVLTVTDAEGCTATETIPVVVFPGIPDLDITPGNTFACEGETITFNAPAGYTYLWSTLETTASIDVTTTGTYSVTITDGNGCTSELEGVSVDFYPLPDASVAGNPIICDDGCTNLTGPFGVGYMYVWRDAFGVVGTSNNLNVCSGSINNPYILEVTDANGCSNISDEIFVNVAISPNFSVNVSPIACEGQPITLSVNPVEPDVNYNWSNGETGTSIVVYSAGLYTAVGTNIDTGCSFSASAVVNPLPDLCIVPEGCYQVCDPDTVCGPLGLDSYQWLFNGTTISGMPGMPHCIEVTESGNYNLIATNEFGCTDTTGTLILDVINCDADPCDDLTVDFDYINNTASEPDSCCVSLSYSNNSFLLAGLEIRSSDAELLFDIASIDPSLNETGYDLTQIGLASNVFGNAIPSDINNFIDLCFGEVYNDPQYVIIDWYDFTANVVCSDTLVFNCPVEPDCAYLETDSIYCDDDQQITYEITICNPNDADFAVGYVDFEIDSPVGIVMTPSVIDITGSPILPGTCQSFSFVLDGADISGETFCYQLLTHAFNPLLDPTTECCTLDTTYCIEIPVCDPCEDVGVESVHQIQDGDCCYSVDIYNDFDDDFFDEIAVCVISPNTTINVNNPFGSGWFTSDLTSTSVSFLPEDGSLDFGISTLPEICVDTDIAPEQYLEIKWMKDGEIYCTDTISVFCEPDCGYFIDETIDCSTTGGWVFSSTIKNMTDYVVDKLDITFVDPALAGYNQSILTGPISPLGTFSTVMLNIGAPAMAGDTICFDVTLHELSDDGNQLTCCTFRHCIVLPDCGTDPDCYCEPEFYEHVLNGIECVQDAINPNLYYFELTDSPYFQQECDRIQWNFSGTLGSFLTEGNEGIFHDFGSAGFESVCIRVERLDANGEKCVEKFCKVATVKNNFLVYPNPSEGLVNVISSAKLNSDFTVEIRDVNNRPIFSRSYEGSAAKENFRVNISDASPGLYFMHIIIGEERYIEKISKF